MPAVRRYLSFILSLWPYIVILVVGIAALLFSVPCGVAFFMFLLGYVVIKMNWGWIGYFVALGLLLAGIATVVILCPIR